MRSTSLYSGAAIAAAGLALYGLSRLAINVVGVRVFGAAFVGETNSTISLLSLVAVVVFSAPSVTLSRFASELDARGERGAARRILGALVCACLIASSVVLLVIQVVPLLREIGSLKLYAAAYGVYLIGRAALLAFGQTLLYLRCEALAFAASIAVFAVGCASGRPSLAASAFVVQPLTFGLLSAPTIWGHSEFIGAGLEARARWRELTRYTVLILVNAVAGLASFHLTIVLATYLWRDSSLVGYLSVMLSCLSPLNLLPTALAAVLFPALARGYGAADVQRQRELVRSTTTLISASCLIVTVPLVLGARPVLSAIGVPGTTVFVATWVIIVLAASLTIVSSPSGHFLNASEHTGTHAAISAGALVLSVIVGMAALAPLGMVGAGMMRGAGDSLSAVSRLAICQSVLRWIPNWRGAWRLTWPWGIVVGLVLTNVPVALTVSVCSVLVVLQVRTIVDGLRHDHGERASTART